MAINGVMHSWESVSIQGPQGEMLDVESIDYEDSRGVRRVMGKGSLARGYSRGNYEGKGSLVMRREEYELLADAVGPFMDMEPVTITASYDKGDGKVLTDTLESVVFYSRKSGGKQDDESINVTLDFEVLDEIKWNGRSNFATKGATSGGNTGTQA